MFRETQFWLHIEFSYDTNKKDDSLGSKNLHLPSGKLT